MRVQVVQVATITQARELCPWACKIVKVSDGWKCMDKEASA